MEFFKRDFFKKIDWPKAQKDMRKAWSILSGKTIDRSSSTATVFSNVGERINKSVKGLQSHSGIIGKSMAKRPKLWRMGSVVGLTIVGLNATNNLINKMFKPTPVIPEYYDQGYDNIKESLTDFGSPVKLAKTASKIITPYKSSVRRATCTTTNTIINRNAALYASSNAIKHTRY